MAIHDEGVRLQVVGEQAFLSAMKSAQTATERFGQAAGGASPQLAGMSAKTVALGTALGTILTQAASAAGRALTGLVSEGLNAYAQFEMLGMSLTSLTARELVNTGAAKDMTEALGMAAPKAKELQDWVQKLAITSPFTSAGVADAFRTAMAYGFTTDESKRLTTAMIDFASATGGTEAGMGRIALALGQIKAKGTLAGQEVLQLTEAGLPVNDILAKAFNVTTAELMDMREKGLIPADEAIEAITKSIETDFAGSAERASTTFSGLLSSLTDIKSVGLREFFSGAFEAIQPYLTKFVNWMTKPETLAMIKAWGAKLGDFVKGAIEGFQAVVKEISRLFDILKGGNLMDLFTTFEDGSSYIGGFLELLGMGEDQAFAFGDVIATAFRRVYDAAVTIFGPLISAVQNAMATVGAAVSGFLTSMVQWWISNRDQIVPILQSIWASVTSYFQAIVSIITGVINAVAPFIAQFLASVSQWWSEHGVQVLQVVQDLWTSIVGIVQPFAEFVVTLVQVLMEGMSAFWTAHGQQIMDYVLLVWQTISDIFRTVSIVVGDIFKGFTALLKGDTEGFKAYMLAAWDTLWTAIKSTAVTWWTNISDWFKGIVKEIGEFFTSTDWGSVGRSILDGIWGGIQAGWSWLSNQVSNLAQSLLQAAKKALGIKSPSRAFEKVGIDMMLGMEKGVLETTRRPVRATALASQMVLAPATAAASYAYNNSYATTTSYNLNMTTMTSPQVVRNSFAIMRMLAG